MASGRCVLPRASPSASGYPVSRLQRRSSPWRAQPPPSRRHRGVVRSRCRLVAAAAADESDGAGAETATVGGAAVDGIAPAGAIGVEEWLNGLEAEDEEGEVPEVEALLAEREEQVAALRRELAAAEAEAAALRGAAVRARRRYASWRSEAEAGAEKLRGELSDLETAMARARLSAMVYRLGAVLGQPLEMLSLVATSGFGEIVTAKHFALGEVIVKFSQQRAWRCWSGNAGENLALLKRESDCLAYLNTLEGSDRHVVRLIEPYCEFDVSLGEGQPERIGALIMERGSWNLGTYVKARLSEGSEAGLAAAATTIQAWEDSVKWLHSHGVLHLDIKADNAVCFEGGAVKLIDVAGMLTRTNISDEASSALESTDLVWDTADLEEQGMTFVSTITYRQPVNLGPGRRYLDYSADWWSMGVSKMEVLGAQPAFFENGEETAKLVWRSIGSGELEDALRRQMAAVLLEPDPSSDEVSVWVDSVMQNLQGRPARVDYFAPRRRRRQEAQQAAANPARRDSKFASVSEDMEDDLHL